MKTSLVFLALQIVFILYLNKLRLNQKFKLTITKIAFLSTLLFYVMIVATAFFLKFKYQYELDSFDVNKDGFFSGNEINDEQQKAMQNVIADTGRNLAPIFGIVISIIYLIVLLPILLLIDKLYTTFKLKLS